MATKPPSGIRGHKIGSKKSGENVPVKKRFSSKKPGEKFFRLTPDAFVTLVLQAAQVTLEEQLVLKALEEQRQTNEEDNGSEIDTTALTEDPVEKALLKNGISTTERSTLQSVIVGVGETDFRTESQRMEARKLLGMQKPVDTSKPYLLLDVRDEEEFQKCHIISALNYSSVMLARMYNYETRELLAFRNVPGKLIIFCDNVEHDSPRVASTLFERGYDNVYILSGGMKSAYRFFPEGLLSGVLPAEVLRLSPELATRRPGRVLQAHAGSVVVRSSSSPSIATQRSFNASSRRSNKTAVKSKDDKKTHWKPYDDNGQLKETFTDEELMILRARLEHNLLPKLQKGTLANNTLSSRAQSNSDSGATANKPKQQSSGRPWY